MQSEALFFQLFSVHFYAFVYFYKLLKKYSDKSDLHMGRLLPAWSSCESLNNFLMIW